ncbi:MAG: Calx-beta domain-containing protein [Microthrixaceae bacterium]
MNRGFAGMLLAVLILAAAPAEAQNGSVWLSPTEPARIESAGEVVLTISLWRAGRVAYQTYDGACSITYSPGGTSPDATCNEGGARAPDDYTAASGELVFTEVEGSKTIKIPIADDDRAEGDEGFTFAAWEVANADPWIDRGDSVIVTIIDDEASDGRAVATTTTAPERRPPGAAPLATVPSLPDPIGDRAVPGLAHTALPSEITPGPGFELTGDGSLGPAAAREGERGGPTSGSFSGLAAGVGASALGLSALAAVRRRGRWSPTRA